METKVWIILGCVLGALVFTFVIVLVLALCTKNRRKTRRIFSLRAVTPLDDAEFESWRRPSQYTKRPELYGIRPMRPSVVRTQSSAIMFEKDINLYDRPHTPPRSLSESESTTSPIKYPNRARRKSSASLQDRPPTPYSPTASPKMDQSSRRDSRGSRHSRGHVHYPSMSEASEFDFGFDTTPPQHNERFSSQSERPLQSRTRERSDV